MLRVLESVQGAQIHKLLSIIQVVTGLRANFMGNCYVLINCHAQLI